MLTDEVLKDRATKVLVAHYGEDGLAGADGFGNKNHEVLVTRIVAACKAKPSPGMGPFEVAEEVVHLHFNDRDRTRRLVTTGDSGHGPLVERIADLVVAAYRSVSAPPDDKVPSAA